MIFNLKVDEASRYNYHVFHPGTSKIIAVFKQGKFESTDEGLCNKLISLGYKPEETLEENQADEIIETQKNIAEEKIITSLKKNRKKK